MRLTKVQLERLAQYLSERAIERVEEREGNYTEEQWDNTMGDLIIEIENILDRTWPNHIPPREALTSPLERRTGLPAWAGGTSDD
jgi:hypothetical protein